MEQAYWIGTAPERCDLCNVIIENKFIDGRVARVSAWACMCPSCHGKHGAPLGKGGDQEYKK